MNELTLSVDSSTFGVHIKVSLFFLKEVQEKHPLTLVNMAK